MNRKLMMYNTETRAVTTLCTGPNSFPLCIWRDPKTGRDWVYVNACDAGGEYARNWSDGWDQMFRFPIDNPKSREIFWDRTKSSEFFTLSSDGTRACFAPTFFNIGDLALVYDDKGKINQEKSTFKPVGRGCFPGISPDNSYRMFHLTGNHHSIFMYDSGGANRRSIQLDTLPGAENTGRQVWLTRWSTDPRFLTCMGPADRAGAAIWLGRFDKDFTKIEGWVRISAPGPKCWKSHAWIEPASITGP